MQAQLQAEIPEFEELSPIMVARENVLARRWGEQSWNLHGAGITLQPVPIAFALASADHWGVITVLIAGRQAEIFMPLESLERIVTAIDPSLGPDRLDPHARALVVEHALAPILDAFEKSTQITIELRSVTAPQGLEPHGAFGLRAVHSTFGEALIIVQCDHIVAQRLTPYIERWPMESARPSRMTTAVSFRIGYTSIDLQALYDLGLGDGIILDSCSLEQNCVMAVVAERYVARCGIGQDGIQLVQPLLSYPSREMEEFLMVDHPQDQRGEAPPRVGAFGELPITLVFELGRLELPLDEVETIREGFIFNLNKTRMQSVDIMTGGRVIGSGEIVKIGDSFGVRVRNFARP